MGLAVERWMRSSLAAMRRLALISCLLAACTLALPGSGSGPATEGPGALAAEEITVTPLAPPGTASADPSSAADVEAAPASGASVEADAPAPDAAETAQEGAAAATIEEDPAAEVEADAAAADAAEPEAELEPAPPLSPEAVACERRNGTWAKTPSGGSVCVRRTRDGGKACSRESQCESLCLARSGTCAPITPVFGCNDIFQDDGRRVTLCLD
jgi:hypothetical protein